MASFGFCKKYRIYKRNDFLEIFKRGKKFYQSHLIVSCIENETSYQRLGISIGRKFGTAPQRNRFKRMVRESFRQCPLRYRGGIDIVIMPNLTNKTLKWNLISQEVNSVMEQGLAWLQSKR